ncbi:MAG: PAS domain S-box protein [bacterium]
MQVSRDSWRIGAGVITASVVIGVSWVLTHRKYQKTVITQIQQQLLTIAKTTASGLEEFITEYSNALKSISINPLVLERVSKRIAHKSSDNTSCPFDALYKIHRYGAGSFTILDANGLVLDRHPFIEEMIGVDFSKRPDVAYVLREHKSYISDMFDNYLGKPAVAISEPVFDNHRFVGIVRWMIEIDTISKRFIEPARIDGIGYAWVFDDRNIIIAHPRKDLIKSSVFEAMRKIHLEAGDVFDRHGITEYFPSDHDYLNRVKREGEGYGIDVTCMTHENDLVAFKKISIGKGAWYLIVTAPYSDIAGTIHENDKNSLGLAGLLILILAWGGFALFKIQKRKGQLEIETAYLKQLAESAESLRESEEKLAGIIASVPDSISIIDQEHTIVWANQTITGVFGQDTIGRKCYAVYHRRDRICESCLVRQCFEDGKIHEQEREFTEPGGKRLFLWFIASVAAYHKDGRPRLVVEVSRNITQRKVAEELLLQERNRARKYIDIAGVMLVAIGVDQKVALINKKGCEVLGYREEEIIGRNWFDNFLPEGIKETVKSVFGRLIAGDIEPAECFENPVLTRKGEERIIAWHNTVLTDDRGEIIGALGSGEDITDRKRAEEERMRLEKHLRQVQKMQAIGTLAGGIAHDFNNILSAIIGYMELSLDEVPEGSSVRDNIIEVLKACQRATDLVRQILTFSRQHEPKREPLQIALVIKEALKLLRASLPASIEIRQNINNRSEFVLADPTQIHQVMMNLGTNAAYAMRNQGGVLEVSLREVNLDAEAVAAYPDLSPGPYLQLTIEDTGCGIAPENLDRIFDPFFTTKGSHGGTGLGLSVVQGIVKGHGGMITVSSTLGKGTAFHIFLPKIEEKDTQPEEIPEHIPLGRERILLIDDEISLINVGQQMLKHLGYEVVATTSSLEAIKLFCAQPEQFDLAIIDQTMPTMSGTEVAKRLMAIRPDFPIILCTGYSETVTEEKAMDMGIKKFIMKPFDMHTLVHVAIITRPVVLGLVEQIGAGTFLSYKSSVLV